MGHGLIYPSPTSVQCLSKSKVCPYSLPSDMWTKPGQKTDKPCKCKSRVWTEFGQSLDFYVQISSRCMRLDLEVQSLDRLWTWESRVWTDLVLCVQCLDRPWTSESRVWTDPVLWLILDKVWTDTGQSLDKVWTSRPLSVQPPFRGEHHLLGQSVLRNKRVRKNGTQARLKVLISFTPVDFMSK